MCNYFAVVSLASTADKAYTTTIIPPESEGGCYIGAVHEKRREQENAYRRLKVKSTTLDSQMSMPLLSEEDAAVY